MGTLLMIIGGIVFCGLTVYGAIQFYKNVVKKPTPPTEVSNKEDQ